MGFLLKTNVDESTVEYRAFYSCPVYQSMRGGNGKIATIEEHREQVAENYDAYWDAVLSNYVLTEGWVDPSAGAGYHFGTALSDFMVCCMLQGSTIGFDDPVEFEIICTQQQS